MNRKLVPAFLGALIVILVIAVVALAQSAGPKEPPAPASPETDPQTLLIPRWFLSALTLDGQAFDIPAGQQKMTLQFKPDGNANGTGGCNNFGSAYAASADGKLHFDSIVSTEMACADDNAMRQESAYFQALAKVRQFKLVDGKLTLSSADGNTTVVFIRPPK